jgi:hypothetical protein
MADYHKTMELGRRLLDKNSLFDWVFDVRNLANPRDIGPSTCGPIVGYCSRDRQAIYVDSRCPQRHVRQTILHEIAHALTPNDPAHGDAWQEMAGRIGCSFLHVMTYFRPPVSRPISKETAS